ncbi:MAG: DNA repair protein RecO, partial [Erysipelotrichaceae bacterium]|nr:DNA repair protein RecO [Erysipelotrichaceae bacterium]
SQVTGMNDKITAFVLNQSDYKEADVLMQVASKEYGIISLVGKAGKKLSSKNHFLPMCLYEFIIDYKEGKDIFSIHGYKLLENYFEDKDIGMMSFKNVILELVLKNRDIDCFDPLLFVFRNINKENRYLPGCMFLSYIIKRFGITPIVDGCALCGNKKVVTLSNRHGGFLCLEHMGSEHPLPVETLKKFRLIIKGEFKDYEVLKQFPYDYRDFTLLMDFYLANSDVRLRSYDFYKTIN